MQRPKRTLHVGDVGLEFIQRGGDAGLDLGGLSPRRAVRGDLVQGLLRHLAGVVVVAVSGMFDESQCVDVELCCQDFGLRCARSKVLPKS